MSTKDGTPDLYKESGVDVDKGDRLVDWLLADGQEKGAKRAGRYGQVVSGIGGFAGLFRPNFSGMDDPILVSGTDGVGTKVLLGIETGELKGLGQDLVAMCVNDLYTIGARPLFFLDYYATGALNEDQFKAVLKGIKEACAMSQAALLGGETAEMPGLYEKGHFDLAGFVVGVVDGKKAMGPDRVQVGDHLYGLTSSGFHSNGFSLIRRWVETMKPKPSQELLQRLMTPTKIYSEIPALVDILGPARFHALANITGGGISGNLPRVMPAGTIAEIKAASLPTPAWMTEFIVTNGTTPLAQEAVFNLGVGMIAIVAADAAADFEAEAQRQKLDVKSIGVVKAGSGEASVRFV